MSWIKRLVHASDGHDIALYELQPEQTPKAVVHIVHGMAEHGGRYLDFAKTLVADNFHVVAHDHRGHGRSLVVDEPYGHFADVGGWDLATYDIELVRQVVVTNHLPYFIFGHSMGALLSMSYAQNFGERLQGIMLSALAPDQPLLRAAGNAIARFQLLLGQGQSPAGLLTKLTFGKFNSAFKPARTEFDWLSKEEKEVDAYINDAQCGGECSVRFFSDLSRGVKSVWKKSSLKKLPSALPILLIAGGMDPVIGGASGAKTVRLILEEYANEVDQVIYEQGRHEMLNDSERQQVKQDLLHWLQKHVK